MEQPQHQERPLKVIGRYAVFGKLASGGMATVHLGRLLGPAGFSRTVAIKRLHPQFAKDPEFVAMFLDEARLAARIQHPNVVATVDVVARDDELFLVMDYVRGESFSRLLRASRKRHMEVPPRVIANIVAGMCYGLHAAHEAKDEHGIPLSIVHRDVSPQNVIVGADGVPRVLDFGVAKAAARVQVTRDGQMKGKLCYMSPEQLRGADVDRRSDVFAAGIVLWEALTGRRLFDSDDAREILDAIIKRPVPPPSSVAAVPKVFDMICSTALAKDPDERFQTAREFAVELEDAVSLASPREVGEWVERVAGALLSRREEMVAEIESVSAVSEVSLVSESSPQLMRALDRRSATPPPTREVAAASEWEEGPTTVIDTEAIRRKEPSTRVQVPRPTTRPPPPPAVDDVGAMDFDGEQTTLYDSADRDRTSDEPPPLPPEVDSAVRGGAKRPAEPPVEVPAVVVAGAEETGPKLERRPYRPAQKTIIGTGTVGLPHVAERFRESHGPPKRSSTGLLVGGVSLAIVVFGGVYFFAKTSTRPTEPVPTEASPVGAGPAVATGAAQDDPVKSRDEPQALDPSDLPAAEPIAPDDLEAADDEDDEAEVLSGRKVPSPRRSKGARHVVPSSEPPSSAKPAPEEETTPEEAPEALAAAPGPDLSNPYAGSGPKPAPAPKVAPKPAPAPAPAPKAAASKPAGCAQPFIIDEKGIKRIKPECL